MSSKPKISVSNHLETDDLKSIEPKHVQTVLSGLGISKKNIRDYIFELKARQLGMLTNTIEEANLKNTYIAIKEVGAIRAFLEQILKLYPDDDQPDDIYDIPDLEPGLIPFEPDRQRANYYPHLL